jgi:uncharacterized protein (TIGR02466 family)
MEQKSLVEMTPFSTSIYAATLNNIPDIVNDIIKLNKEQPASISLSNYGGWQSKNYSFGDNDPTFMKPIVDAVIPYIQHIFQHMGIDVVTFRSHYWFNINKKYNYNISHMHPCSYYSAVLYLKVPKNSGNIVFCRPDDLRKTITFKTLLEHNIGEFVVEPKPNTLLIFPSFITHYVQQNMTDDEDDTRISIAFNFR